MCRSEVESKLESSPDKPAIRPNPHWRNSIPKSIPPEQHLERLGLDEFYLRRLTAAGLETVALVKHTMEGGFFHLFTNGIFNEEQVRTIQEALQRLEERSEGESSGAKA